MSNRTKKNGTGDAFLAKLESKAVAIHDRERLEQQPPPQAFDPSVVEMMTKDVAVCGCHDTAERCARLMWERGCGCVPVVDFDGRPIAMVTDRDVCMAAYTQGKPLSSISVDSFMSKQIYAVGLDVTISTAEKVMRRHGIRRIPVVDTHKRLIGILSFSDIALHGRVPPALGNDGLSANAIAETAASTSHVSSRPPPIRA